MVANEKVVTIDRPIYEVFDYVSDPLNIPHWQAGFSDVRLISASPLGVGTRFTSVRKFMGRKSQADIEFTDFKLNKKIAFKSVTGSTPFEELFLFEPADRGTRLTVRLGLQPSGLLGLAKPLIASGLKREVDEDIDILKETIETRVVENFELVE